MENKYEGGFDPRSSEESRTNEIEYAAPEVSQKRIFRHLKKHGVEYSEVELSEAIASLYAQCETQGSAPTREALATLYSDTEAMEQILSMKKDPFRPKSKTPLIASVIAVVVVIAACVGAFAYAQTTAGALYVQVNVDNWNKETSTPVEVEVYQGDVKDALVDEDDSNDPEVYVSVTMDANTQWRLEDIAVRGTYTVEVECAPVLEDGTLFKTPEPQVVTLEGEDVSVTFDLEVLDLETASEEEVEEAASKAEEVAEASGSEAAKSAAATASEKATSKSTSSSASSSSGNSGSSSASSGSSSSSSGSSSSSSGSSSSSSSSGSGSTHTHSWTPVYGEKQVPVYSTVTVTICDTCGAENPSREHLKNHVKNGGTDQCHNETRKEITGYTTEKYIKYYVCSCGATK